jgi:hypothetical protein
MAAGGAVAARPEIFAGLVLPDQPADLSSRAVREKLSPAAINAFLKLAKRWGVKDEEARQLLGGVSAGTFYGLKRGTPKTLDQDQLTRVSLLLGIFKALAIIFPPGLATVWPSRANDNVIFHGSTPLSYIVAGGIPAMMLVRQLLDARRGVR